VDEATEASLAGLGDLAPLHNPPALALLDRVRALDDRPAVACFDTAFFADLPAAAATYAVPEEWRAGLGVRRYGFHGLSHAWASRRGAELEGRAVADRRVVTAHLGAGASLAAVEHGRAVDTTMGFTPLEGLVMATRSGSVDPGALVHVLRRGGLSADDLDDALERRSGLLALAGTPDLAEVRRRADRGDGRAQLAWDVYLHRLRAALAAMTAAMGGVDLLVFTGGAGEGSATLRAEAVGGLGFLGLDLDPVANAGSGDRLLSVGGPPAVAVVGAREDLEMARQAEAVLAD
jgi:acetate kinase